MTRYGITIPLDDIPLPEQRDVIAELPALGYTDVWTGEAAAADAFTPLALASAWAPELRLGTAIVPAYTRGPALLAQSAATLAAAAPDRVAIGIGTSTETIVEHWNAIDFTEPYHRVRDTVQFLRTALTGAKVTKEYRTFTVNGFRLQLVPEVQPKLLVAALRPGMLKLAGAEADGAIVNWLSADDVRTVAPYVHGGGADTSAADSATDTGGAGRADREIVARIFVAPSQDRDQVRAIARRAIAGYLTVPVYRAFHEWLGRTDALAGLWQAWEAGDRAAALAAIGDEVIDALVVHGSPDEIRAHVARYVDAGVTTPVLALLPVGRDVREVVRELAPAS